MKKFLLPLLIFILSLTFLTGCGTSSYNFDSAYWQQDTTAPLENVNEVSVYDVKVVSQTLSDKTIVKNDSVSMVITNGTYTTALKNTTYKETACYEYKTTLSLQGYYEFDDKKEEFNDNFTTISYFKPYSSNFAPIESSKSSTSNTIYYNGELVKFSYEYKITYSGSNAKTSYTRYDKDGKEEEKKNKSYSDLKDGTYIDNDLLLLMPRTINLKNSVSLSFSTVDVVRQSKVGMSYSGGKNNVKVLEGFKYSNRNSEITSNLEVSQIKISITDTFTGTPIESYYALNTTDSKDNRQRLIKAYTPLNDSLGYLEYTLTSVNY